jgi:hypothetical protein
MALRQVARSEAAGKPVEVLLRPSAMLSGRVADEQRRPVAGSKVQAWDPEARTNLAPLPTTRTAEDGSFTLRRGAVITGVVTAEGEPLAGVQMSLSPGRSSFGTPPRTLAQPSSPRAARRTWR